MSEKKVIDVRGHACPIPVIETKRAVEKWPAASLEVIVDNEVSRENVCKFGLSKGYGVNWLVKEGNFHIILVPKDKDVNMEAGQTENGDGVNVLQDAEKGFGIGVPKAIQVDLPVEKTTTAGEKNTTAGKVLLFTKHTLGQGDEELGTTLMKNFIFCVAESMQKPKAMYFINKGVFLTAETSACLDDLQRLAEAGVRIASCGICLNYYHLKETLGVGEITNMYAIAEGLLTEEAIVL